MVVVLDGLFVATQLGLGVAAAEVGTRIVRIEADGPVVVGNGFLEAAHGATGFRPLEIEAGLRGSRRIASLQSAIASSRLCNSSGSEPGRPSGGTALPPDTEPDPAVPFAAALKEEAGVDSGSPATR